MRRIWHTAFIGLIAALHLWLGYYKMTPEQLARSNPDAVFCTLVLVTMTLFPFVTVWMSGGKHLTLRRPSWRRLSIKWQNDPLEHFFLISCFAACLVVGAAFHLPGTSETGFWMFMFFVCLSLGSLLGQFLVYRIYRERIIES